MRTYVFSLGVSSLLLPLVLAAPILNNTVATPFGPRPAASVIQVPENGKIVRVDGNIHVLDASGSIVHVAKSGKGEGSPARRSVAVRDNVDYGLEARWTNTGSSPITSFTATWVVPPIPTESERILFICPGLQTTDEGEILGPQLQWGGSAAGGGEYWSIATWYTTTTNSFITAPIEVFPGQMLIGLMQQTSTATGYNFVSEFTNISGTTITVESTESLEETTLIWEGGGNSLQNSFPEPSITQFTNLTIQASGGTPTVNWVCDSGYSGDGVDCTIPVQGATNAIVAFAY